MTKDRTRETEASAMRREVATPSSIWRGLKRPPPGRRSRGRPRRDPFLDLERTETPRRSSMRPRRGSIRRDPFLDLERTETAHDGDHPRRDRADGRDPFLDLERTETPEREVCLTILHVVASRDPFLDLERTETRRRPASPGRRCQSRPLPRSGED